MDGKPSAHFEHTIAITDNGPLGADRPPEAKRPRERSNRVGEIVLAVAKFVPSAEMVSSRASGALTRQILQKRLGLSP